jgi:phosphatidylserine/phosphatidylglycerophosphate/cardiolipin synthase-like enzyme
LIDSKLSFLTGREIYDAVVEGEILKAREKLRIATATLKNLHADAGRRRFSSAVDFLFSLASRGVDVEVLHGAVPSGPFLADLKKSWPPPGDRVSLKLCPRVHFKAVIVDYRGLYLGSANFTGAGMGAKSPAKRNFEIGIFTETPEMLDAVNMLFDSIWFGEACETCGRKAHCPVPLEEFSP